MDEKSLAFVEGQLKRVGMGEAFTPDLVEKLKQGNLLIQQPFDKKYDGDELNILLHLKKSNTTDYYFLNKYDMQLQKEGQEKAINQTFYVPPVVKNDQDQDDRKIRHDNKYTMKEAYNLLAGRPVFKHLTSKEGGEYEAWVKLNPKNILSNGNHELKQYNKNYGFELENVLKQYPIKELTNEQYRQSLIESLHRGNRQKVTFLGKDGKEEQLYVSPSITTGSLNVYDVNKKIVPLDKLVEQGHINKEMADQLKQQFGQKQDLSVKQEHIPVEAQQQKNSAVQEEKIGNAKKQKKQKPKI